MNLRIGLENILIYFSLVLFNIVQLNDTNRLPCVLLFRDYIVIGMLV